MKAYPTVTIITRFVCNSFKSSALTLILIIASVFGYAQGLATASSGRECYTPLKFSGNAVATGINSSGLKQAGNNASGISETDPVKLSAFSAVKKNESKVSLEWTTSEEINTSHFVVERSFDGVAFDEAALVFAYGDSKEQKVYTFTDMPRKKHFSVVYYRLRIVDMNGRTERSSTRVIGNTD